MRMRRYRATLSLGVVAVGLAAAGCARMRKPPALWFERTSHAASATVNADGLTALQVRGGAANVRVVADTTDLVRVEVSLRSSDSERLNRTCVPTARLDTTRSNGVLSVRVHQPSRDRCGESWSVTAPSRLLVSLDFANADVEAHGFTGGLSASLTGTGKIRGTAVRGDVDVRVGVGDIDLSVDQREYADVSLASDVGSVRLELGGYDVPPAERRGSGQRITLRGAGTGRVTARSRVGDVRLTIAAPR